MEGVYALIAGSGWASGLSLYLVVTLLGVAGRFGVVEVPELLTSPWVIAGAAALYLVEFVVDKVPYLDGAWDALHTVVRPAGAAVLGWLIADSAGLEALTGSAAGSGALAFLAHGAKASARAAINTSPEPLSNIAVSVFEDGLVAGVLLLAVANPLLALAVVAVLVVAGVAVVVLLWRAAGRLRARWRAGGRPPSGTGRGRDADRTGVR